MSQFSPAIQKIPALEKIERLLAARPFLAPPLLRNGHAMTILGTQRPRRFSIRRTPAERREFATEPGTRVVAYCHWQPNRLGHPLMLIIHGLEGSSEGVYSLGTASKAFAAGFNVLRYNVRGCGSTAHLTSTLYHSGLTVDLHHVVRELIERDGFGEIFLVGFSMGGNQALKFAGELGLDAPLQLKGVCAISPPIDLASCARSLMRRENWIYEIRFLRSLRATLRTRDRLFPGIYDTSRLGDIRSLWDWDEAFQHHNGFAGARDYYTQASSLNFIPKIEVPTLIIHAQDDPFISFAPFTDPPLHENPHVLFVTPEHGGHVAFCSTKQPDEDRSWAENRAVEFSHQLSAISHQLSSQH